jgi:hypothetical protein
MKYTVQQEREFLVNHGDQDTSFVAWVDIATVEVEPRTKRSTVIKKALAQAGIKPSDAGIKLRALDAESSEVFEPKARQVEPEWVIG